MGNSVLRRAAQYYANVIASPDDLTPGSYSLYLRSFNDDRRLASPHRVPLIGGWLSGTFSLSHTEEERLSAALSWAGPVVAVGEPGERVPHAGATRMYLPLDNWKGPVRELMRGASLVVIALGKGRGTLWEIGEAMRILPPERLLLLVPMTRKGYEEFRELAAKVFQRQAKSEYAGHRWSPSSLPDYVPSRAVSPRIRGLVYFTPGWKSEFVSLDRPTLFEDQLMGALDRGMWPAMVQLTDYELRTSKTHG